MLLSICCKIEISHDGRDSKGGEEQKNDSMTVSHLHGWSTESTLYSEMRNVKQEAEIGKCFKVLREKKLLGSEGRHET